MRVEIDHGGIVALLSDPGLGDEMVRHAVRGKWVALGIGKPYRTGHYAGAMFAQRGYGRPHVYALYGSHDFKAHWVESGTVRQAGEHVLVRAGRLAGFMMRDVRR